MPNLQQIAYNVGSINLNFYSKDKTLWLSPTNVATLLGTDLATIQANATNANPGDRYAHLQAKNFRPIKGAPRETHYNLPLILAIAYRTDTPESKDFRRHTKAHFKNYLKKKGVRHEK